MMINTLEPIVHAEDLFSGLRPEKEFKGEKVFEFRKNSKLEKMIKSFEKILTDLNYPFSMEDSYEKISGSIRRKYNSKEIESLSLMLKNYQDNDEFEYLSGIFLSNLINSSQDQSFLLHLSGLETNVSGIGMYSSKNITINGDVGNNTGFELNGGQITLIGNAGDYLGQLMKQGDIVVYGDSRNEIGCGMRGGTITINGNVESRTGTHMHGGKIIINGNTGIYPGIFMTGGIIEINGDPGEYIGIQNGIWGGSVYVKGVLILGYGDKVGDGDSK